MVLGALLMMYAEYKTKDNQAELLDDLDKIFKTGGACWGVSVAFVVAWFFPVGKYFGGWTFSRFKT
ncbi:MAG: hypothetical protein ACLRXQ_07815 [Phascolarctobacterium faecium]